MPTQRPTTIRLRTSLYEEATDIVDQEFGSDLSLDEIARRVASSRRQLQRAYAEIGQTTFRDHLTRVRMEKAAELLDPPDLKRAFDSYEAVATTPLPINDVQRRQARAHVRRLANLRYPDEPI